jgi:hypothetical protein
MNASGFLRKPFASGATASGGLFFGENHNTVRFAGFAELHGDGVGGIDFEEMIDAAREGGSCELVAKKLRRKDVGDSLDVIAGGGVSFDADAESAEFFDPAPDLLSGDANLPGDFCAADDDGGIFGEEGEEGVDAAVGGAGKRGHARGGHWEQGSILEANGEDKEGVTCDLELVTCERQRESETSDSQLVGITIPDLRLEVENVGGAEESDKRDPSTPVGRSGCRCWTHRHLRLDFRGPGV